MKIHLIIHLPAIFVSRKQNENEIRVDIKIHICNAIGMGIAPQVVMKWTGHSDYKAMKPYIDVCDDIKAEAMKKFDSF